MGCDTGFLETLIAGKVGSLVAFDATHLTLHQAKAKFAGLLETWVQADGRPCRSGARVESRLLERQATPRYEQVLATMIGVLKPGGKLFLGYEPNNAIP